MFDQRLRCLQPRMPAEVKHFIESIQTMMTSSIELIIYEKLHYYFGTPIWKKHKAAWDEIFKIGASFGLCTEQ